jgi:hypothetical protein
MTILQAFDDFLDAQRSKVLDEIELKKAVGKEYTPPSYFEHILPLRARLLPPPDHDRGKGFKSPTGIVQSIFTPADLATYFLLLEDKCEKNEATDYQREAYDLIKKFAIHTAYGPKFAQVLDPQIKANDLKKKRVLLWNPFASTKKETAADSAPQVVTPPTAGVKVIFSDSKKQAAPTSIDFDRFGKILHGLGENKSKVDNAIKLLREASTALKTLQATSAANSQAQSAQTDAIERLKEGVKEKRLALSNLLEGFREFEKLRYEELPEYSVYRLMQPLQYLARALTVTGDASWNLRILKMEAELRRAPEKGISQESWKQIRDALLVVLINFALFFTDAAVYLNDCYRQAMKPKTAKL